MLTGNTMDCKRVMKCGLCNQEKEWFELDGPSRQLLFGDRSKCKHIYCLSCWFDVGKRHFVRCIKLYERNDIPMSMRFRGRNQEDAICEMGEFKCPTCNHDILMWYIKCYRNYVDKIIADYYRLKFLIDIDEWRV